MNSSYAPAISKELVQFARDFEIWVHHRTHGLELPATPDRVRVSQALFHLSLEHYDSLVILLMNRMVGSAFALERSLIETCVRAKWLCSVASEEEVKKFVDKGKITLSFNELLEEIGNEPETGGRLLSNLKGKNWGFLNGLTHGGMEQVVRRVSKSSIESLYPIEEQRNMIQYAVEIVILILAELFTIANNEALMLELNAEAESVRHKIRSLQCNYEASE